MVRKRRPKRGDMGLTIREGLEIAERQAWAETGRKNRLWFTYGKRLAPVGVLAAVVGAVGWGAYKAWHALAEIFAGEQTAPSAVAGAAGESGVPAGMWVAAVLLIVVTVGVMARNRNRVRRFSSMVLTNVALVIAWCAVIAYGIGTLG